MADSLIYTMRFGLNENIDLIICLLGAEHLKKRGFF
jgi:hypothetical protein